MFFCVFCPVTQLTSTFKSNIEQRIFLPTRKGKIATIKVEISLWPYLMTYHLEIIYLLWNLMLTMPVNEIYSSTNFHSAFMLPLKPLTSLYFPPFLFLWKHRHLNLTITILLHILSSYTLNSMNNNCTDNPQMRVDYISACYSILFDRSVLLSLYKYFFFLSLAHFKSCLCAVFFFAADHLKVQTQEIDLRNYLYK